MGFGFETYEPIEGAIASLVQRKVRMTGEVLRFEGGNSVSFEDPDGTSTYLHEFPPRMVPQPGLEAGEGSNEEARQGMLSGGHAIVYVNNMDAAIRFYTELLGLKLTNRYEDKIATVEAGQTLVVAIHPQTSRSPVPGTKGSVTLGLAIDEPIENVLARLAKHRVRLASDLTRSELGSVAEIEDPDGNSIYLWEDKAELLMPADLASRGSTTR